MTTKYLIQNFGATRKLPYKGQYYEITRNGSIETTDKQLADEFSKFLFVDVKVIEQPIVKALPSKRKKKVATVKKNKTIKHRKIKEK